MVDRTQETSWKSYFALDEIFLQILCGDVMIKEVIVLVLQQVKCRYCSVKNLMTDLLKNLNLRFMSLT